MDYLKIAIEAARKAGAIHKKYFGKNFKVSQKSFSFDLVTSVDLKAEKAVVSFIRKYFPEHNFLAEENRYQQTGSEYTWIIDPLDGTN
ncbi:MAG: inositol monophosphatase, partial [Candidatus Omnitrophica bacterium]|nr:inositol monophosphatase [Candidatus Omnitrophota bacterium]